MPSGQELVCRILEDFPTDPALIKTSSAIIFLQQLSSVVFAFPPDLFSTDTARQIGQYKVYVEDALPVLTVLCSTDFSTVVTTDATSTSALQDPEGDDEEFLGPAVRNKKQQKSRGKNKDNTTIDPTPFQKLDAEVPLNNSEASQLICKTADNLKTILKVRSRLSCFPICGLTHPQFYLELLREPFLAQHLRDTYISIGKDRTTYRPAVPRETKVIGAAKPEQSAYPKVQPMKAALYFENADGFGDWRIIIGADAIRTLRELADGDRTKCVVVVKKIKYVATLSLFKLGALTVVIGNSRRGTFPMIIRRDLMHSLGCLFSRRKCSGTFALL